MSSTTQIGLITLVYTLILMLGLILDPEAGHAVQAAPVVSSLMRDLQQEMNKMPQKYPYIYELQHAYASGNQTYWVEVWERLEPTMECITFKIEELSSQPPLNLEPQVLVLYLVDAVHNVFDTCSQLLKRKVQ